MDTLKTFPTDVDTAEFKIQDSKTCASGFLSSETQQSASCMTTAKKNSSSDKDTVDKLHLLSSQW